MIWSIHIWKTLAEWVETHRSMTGKVVHKLQVCRLCGKKRHWYHELNAYDDFGFIRPEADMISQEVFDKMLTVHGD